MITMSKHVLTAWAGAAFSALLDAGTADFDVDFYAGTNTKQSYNRLSQKGRRRRNRQKLSRGR